MAFYFAWVDTGDTVFGVEHQVNDEDIFTFRLEHRENEFCSLSVVITNPRVGLLNVDRPQWCWVSYRKPDDSVVPLFHGRLMGIPADMTQEVVQLDFIARPDDYEEQKATLAETLKVAPFWDPIFIAEEELDNPDVVLAARPQLWHIGRTDKLLTVSNILIGEAGTLVLTGNDVIAGTLQINYGDTVPKLHMVATVEWNQHAKGTIDFAPALVDAFVAAGSPQFHVASYTGQGLEASWPRFNDAIGSGWTVGESRSNLTNVDVASSDYLSVDIDPSKAALDITIEDWWETSPQGFDFWYDKAYEKALAEALSNGIVEARFYLWQFQPDFELRYTATRRRKETLTFDLQADLQAMTHQEGDPKVMDMTVSSVTVGSPIDPDEELPIGDLKRNRYFALDRGQQSIEYLLNIARSRMLFAARAVEISVEIPFSLALDLSCRHDILLSLPDLPGGEAGGKVIGYAFELDNGGQLTAHVAFGAVVGKGATLPIPTAGEPTYVEEGYVAVGYQHYVGTSLQPIPGEVEYEAVNPDIVDDGIDFDNLTPDSIIADTASTALLTFTGPGVADNNFGIALRVYTLVTVLTDVDQVLIGDDNEETARNAADAINADETNLSVTHSAEAAHADVSAIVGDGIVRITHRVPGVAGNAVALSVLGSDLSWDELTMYDGDDGLFIRNGPNDQAAALSGEFGTVQEAIDTLNENFTEVELSLKPLDGGPFETAYELQVSQLMVPKTIDLEAAA